MKAKFKGSKNESHKSSIFSYLEKSMLSCLGNPMDRGAWQVTVHAVAESDTTEQLIDMV